MWLPEFLTFFCLLVCSAYSINTDQNQFIVPPPSQSAKDYTNNLVLSLGSTQVIQWSTNQTDYYIALFQQTPQSGGIQNQTIYEYGDDSEASSFQWTVQTYGTDLSLSPVYFLWLNPGAEEGFTSHYFNISGGNVDSTTSSSTSLTTSTSTTSTSSTTSLSSVPTTSATITQTTSATGSPTAISSTNSTSASDNSSDHTAVDVGLGVGIGVGGTLVLAIGAFLAWRWTKRRQTAYQAANTADATPGPFTDQKDYYAPPPSQQQQQQQIGSVIHEAPADGSGNEVYEAPANRPIFEAPAMAKPVEME